MGAMSLPLRHAYEQLGPERFYESHGAAYRNPHERAIRSKSKVEWVVWPSERVV